jgi:hypothetical protein
MSHKDGKTYHFCAIRMPLGSKSLGIVKPILAFARKADAKAFTSLLAIKELYDKGYLDDNFFPTMVTKFDILTVHKRVARCIE